MFRTTTTHGQTIVHTEIADRGIYAGATFNVKRIIRKEFVHFPTESTEQYQLRELRHIYNQEYGPLSRETFDKILMKHTETFSSINSNTQSKMFTKLYLSKKIYDIIRKSFNLVIKASPILLITCYESAERLRDDIKYYSYTDPIKYPNQVKMRRSKKFAIDAAKKFIDLVVDYFKENPKELYKLPISSIRAFLQKYPARSTTIYGAWLSTNGWLDVSIANLIRRDYESYKTSWWTFISKCLRLPTEVCKIIADMITQTLVHETFIEFFTKLVPNSLVRYENYARCFDYYRTVSGVDAKVTYDVILYV